MKRHDYGDFTILAAAFAGGSAVTSDLILKPTTGVGTTGADIHLCVGTDGATEVVTIVHAGKVGVGVTLPVNKLHVHSTTQSEQMLISSVAPAVCLLNHATLAGATNQADVGMATSESNFVVGAALGDLVLKTKLLNAGTAGNILFGINTTEVARFTTTFNFCIGATAAGENMTKGLVMGTGYAPTTCPTNAIQMYSKDVVAGNAAPHFATELGQVVKLYQSMAHVADPGDLAACQTALATIIDGLKALGLMAPDP